MEPKRKLVAEEAPRFWHLMITAYRNLPSSSLDSTMYESFSLQSSNKTNFLLSLAALASVAFGKLNPVSLNMFKICIYFVHNFALVSLHFKVILLHFSIFLLHSFCFYCMSDKTELPHSFRSYVEFFSRFHIRWYGNVERCSDFLEKRKRRTNPFSTILLVQLEKDDRFKIRKWSSFR